MIGAGAIERAETTLQVAYGASLDRQLEALQVEREAFDAFVQHAKGVIQKNYGDTYRSMDPRLEAAFNTLILHSFLTGIICGRNSIREIE